MLLVLKGFNSLGISERIELPNEFELLTNIPFLNTVELEEAYKYGGNDIRTLIDKAPLTNSRKYATLESKLQFLTPDVHTVPKLIWHIDTSTFSDEKMAIAHLMISDCTAKTEFTEQDLVLVNFDESTLPKEVMPLLNKNQYMFTPKAIESNRFYTFGGKHLHRCVKAQKPEFRYTFRILESDYITGCNYKDGFKNQTIVFKDSDLLEDCNTESLTKAGTNKSQRFASIIRQDNQIIVNTRY